MILHLHLKYEYFDAIKSGEKTTEYRLYEKWHKRLTKNNYKYIILHRGYQSETLSTRIKVKYKGFKIETRKNAHFGYKHVKVCALDVTN